MVVAKSARMDRKMFSIDRAVSQLLLTYYSLDEHDMKNVHSSRDAELPPTNEDLVFQCKIWYFLVMRRLSRLNWQGELCSGLFISNLAGGEC